eukprot:gene35192-42628_t
MRAATPRPTSPSWNVYSEGISEESDVCSLLNRAMIQSADPCDSTASALPAMPLGNANPSASAVREVRTLEHSDDVVEVEVEDSGDKPQDEEGNNNNSSNSAVVAAAEAADRSEEDPTICNYETSTPTCTSGLVTTLEEHTSPIAAAAADAVDAARHEEYVDMFQDQDDDRDEQVRVDELAAVLSDVEDQQEEEEGDDDDNDGIHEEDEHNLIYEGFEGRDEDSLLSSLSLLLPRKSLDMEPYVPPASPSSNNLQLHHHHHVLDNTPMKIKHHNFEELERLSGGKEEGASKPLAFDIDVVGSGAEAGSGKDILEEMRDRLLRKTNLTFDAMRLEVPSLNKRRPFDINLSDNENEDGDDEDDEEEEHEGEISHETQGSVDAYEI